MGVKAAVLIIVVEALLRVSKRALKQNMHWAIAALAFIGIFFFALPYPLIVLAAALFGFFFGVEHHDNVQKSEVISVSVVQTLTGVVIWLAVWWVPVFLVGQFSGQPILTDIGWFFSKLAVVTFGGAYAVLAYMGQDVVANFGWLTAGEMMDGLGLAETTPGPLILVTEFVGFLAAFREGGLPLGFAGAFVTLWVTFVPCFLWIFTGAPYIDWICNQPRLNGALSAITAAVVGVILNLSIWFGLHVFFDTISVRSIGPLNVLQPDMGSLDWRVVFLSALCGLLLLKFHWSIGRVLVISAATGWVLSRILI